MKFKRKRQASHSLEQMLSDSASRYLQDNILLCYRLRTDLSRSALIRAGFAIQKMAILSDAALFVKNVTPHYLVIIGVLNERAAETLRQSLGSVPDVESCEVPPCVGFAPVGYVFPKDIGDEISSLLASDNDVHHAIQNVQPRPQ